jgi:ABC-2 type transport system permease protein
MKALQRLADSFYIAWAIARKDLLEVLNNKSTRVNIVVLFGMVGFFYWISTPRSFDKRIDTVIYDEGNTSLVFDEGVLGDGTEFAFYEASSLEDMQRKMAYKELGIVLPPDFDEILKSGQEVNLEGYIFWVHRGKAAELETEYSQMFTALLEKPVHVHIGDNIVIPEADVEASNLPYHALFILIWLAISVIPHLMLEEKRTRTLDSLLVSPTTVTQIVLGKALAGLFYVVLASLILIAFNNAYVVNWGLALLAFACIALFAVGLALALSSVIQSPMQLSLWGLLILGIFVIPVLFAQEPFLASWLKALLTWLPTASMAMLVQFSLSSGASAGQLASNLGISLGGIVLVYMLVVWQVRREDR